MEIEELFAKLLESEDTISGRMIQLQQINDEAKSKAMILQNIIDEERANAANYRAQILKDMEDTGLVETTVSIFKIRRKKCAQSVVIEDETIIPGNYIVTKTKVTTAPDKVLIGKLLRAGHEIAGARLSDEEYQLEIKEK